MERSILTFALGNRPEDLQQKRNLRVRRLSEGTLLKIPLDKN